MWSLCGFPLELCVFSIYNLCFLCYHCVSFLNCVFSGFASRSRSSTRSLWFTDIDRKPADSNHGSLRCSKVAEPPGGDESSLVASDDQIHGDQVSARLAAMYAMFTYTCVIIHIYLHMVFTLPGLLTALDWKHICRTEFKELGMVFWVDKTLFFQLSLPYIWPVSEWVLAL